MRKIENREAVFKNTAELPAPFLERVERHRREIHVHCYRMLGSFDEAEDLVQETFLRAWRFQQNYTEKDSLRAWLYKIATNACLDHLRKRSRRTMPVASYPPSHANDPILPPLEEYLWLDLIPDSQLSSTSDPEARYTQQESVRLAFMVALQKLPQRQRAALLLKDVLVYPAHEVAELLGISVSATNSLLYRARKSLQSSDHSQDITSAAVNQPDNETQQLLNRYMQVWETADVQGLVSLLCTDATFAMPPSPSWYYGREAIGLFIDRNLFTGSTRRWQMRPTRANGQPAFAVYEDRDDSGKYFGSGIQVLTLAKGQIQDISTFLNPSLNERFGLPMEL